MVGAVATALVGAVTVGAGIAAIGLGGASPASAAGTSGSWSTMFVANLRSDSLTPIDLATGTAAPSIGLGELPDALAVAPGAKTVYVVEVGSDGDGSPGRVVPLATNNYTLGKAIAVGTDPQAIAIAPDGRMAYVLNGYDAATTPATVPVTITPIDLVTRTALRPVPVGTLPLSMTMSPNGKLIYVVDSSVSHQGEPSGITPFNTSTGKAGPEIKLPQAPYPPFPVSGLVFSPNSATAYAITPSGVVPVNTATARSGKVIGLHTSMPVALAVSPDGSTLAEVGTPITALEQGSPYADNVTLAFLRTATGVVRKVATLGDEPGAVSWQVAMAPDGSTAYVLTIAQSPSLSSLVSSQSTLVRVDVATGKADKALDVGQSAQALAIGPGGTAVYVLVIGPYQSRSPQYGPGRVLPVASTSGLPGRAVPVGELPQAFAIAQPPLDRVQDIVATPSVKSQLVAAFVAGWGLKPDQVAGMSPGSLYYAYDQTTHTYWAEAAFFPAKGDPPSMMEDAGGYGVFSRADDGGWKFRGSALPIFCRELSVVPPAVLALWGLAPTDAADCRG
jgi:DNA-binding beta-propeller fold protein YncE